jgi:hypothetical protein
MGGSMTMDWDQARFWLTCREGGYIDTVGTVVHAAHCTCSRRGVPGFQAVDLIITSHLSHVLFSSLLSICSVLPLLACYLLASSRVRIKEKTK